MKKKIFGAVLVVAIAAGAIMNVNLNKTGNKGDLAMANVEALAQSEGVTVTCGASGGQCWKASSETCKCPVDGEYHAKCERSDDPKNNCTPVC